jgi:hypothetical protein
MCLAAKQYKRGMLERNSDPCLRLERAVVPLFLLSAFQRF